MREKHPDHYESALATVWPTKIPESAEYGPDGENLAKRIRGIREEFDWSHPDFPEGAGSGEQLFDLVADPEETRNLVVDPAHRETRDRLRMVLLEKIVKQDYPHPRRGLFAHGVH